MKKGVCVSLLTDKLSMRGRRGFSRRPTAAFCPKRVRGKNVLWRFARGALRPLTGVPQLQRKSKTQKYYRPRRGIETARRAYENLRGTRQAAMNTCNFPRFTPALCRLTQKPYPSIRTAFSPIASPQNKTPQKAGLKNNMRRRRQRVSQS